jgi:hypothetical protein
MQPLSLSPGMALESDSSAVPLLPEAGVSAV